METVTYEMLIENELTDGVFAISLVDSPAILTDYVLLSKENKIKFDLKLEKLIDKKRKIVCGPVLIPDMIIPRDGYNIVFSEETIRKISENFIINGNKDNSTLQHKIPVNKIHLVESWIVDDPERDKSLALGYTDIKKGTWFVSLKVIDDNLWLEYIESGILKGFSIEGQFSEKEVKMEHSKVNCSCGHNHDDFDDKEYELFLSSIETETFEEDKLAYDIYKLVAKGEKRGGGNGVPDTPNYTAADLSKLYVWKVSEGTEGDCPVCIRNRNKVFNLRQWARIGLPRVPNNTYLGNDTNLSTNYRTNPYATFCETDCKCHLEEVPQTKQPTTTPVSKPKNPYAKTPSYRPKYKRNPNFDPTKPLYSILPNGELNEPFIEIKD